MSNMYDNTATWNPFKGCEFDCIYCKPSFQQQSKRWGKGNCEKCYNYEPHFHPERLDRIPSAETIFVAGSGDISFCSTENVMKIIDAIKDHEPRIDKTYYFQSKDPKIFERFKDELPENAVLLTTLETDQTGFSHRDIDDDKKCITYDDYSNAPLPIKRYEDFKELDYPRKVVTVEPIMFFGPDFHLRLKSIDPEYIWIGFNTRPKQVKLREPHKSDVKWLINWLQKEDIEVRGKNLRGIEVE